MAVFWIEIPRLGEFRKTMAAAPAAMQFEVRKALVESTFVLEAAIKKRTPRRTSRLFSAWRSQVAPDGMEGRVSNEVIYGPFVEWDTRPHDIAPVNAQALMLPLASTGGFGGGRLSGSPRAGQAVGFFRKVRHPGTKGQHMTKLGTAEATPAILIRFRKAIEAAFRTLAS